METTFLFPAIIAIAAIIVLSIFFHFVPFFLWLSAHVSGVHISLVQLFLMRIRNVPPNVLTSTCHDIEHVELKGISPRVQVMEL